MLLRCETWMEMLYCVLWRSMRFATFILTFDGMKKFHFYKVRSLQLIPHLSDCETLANSYVYLSVLYLGISHNEERVPLDPIHTKFYRNESHFGGREISMLT